MPTKNILVVGGAGYIGSHMVQLLKQTGYVPIVYDNLSRGHRESVADAILIEANILDSDALNEAFAKHDVAAVMHFGGLTSVAESVAQPELYYRNNVIGMCNLLDAMFAHQVKNLIFSSSAAVYGDPQVPRINETHSPAPMNPYGRTKLIAEQMIQDYAQAGSLNYVVLRYFNAAGADPAGKLGELHDPETHLIPLLLQVALGERASITINGENFSTPDGTCKRDYIHVSDICSAHLLALKALRDGKKNLILNLGTGQGYTVKQVINAARRVTKHAIPETMGKQRSGDPAVLVAAAELARQELNWQPRFQDLDTIIQHAWQFALKNHKKT